MKYRKKPLVVEAWRWLPDVIAPPPAWITDALNIWPDEGGIAFWPDGNRIPSDYCEQMPHITIARREGVMRALPGDWIINGLVGGLLPCKPDSFESIYEPAKDQEDPEPLTSPPPWGSL